jgi:hypothetical protein
VVDFEGIAAERFFRRVTRFAGKENRLTEVLAAVLERIPELAWGLACAWTDPAQEHSTPGEVPRETTSGVFAALADLRHVSVSTQVRTASGKQVDLALRFGGSATPSIDDVLLWVEIKHGAPPHEGQLANYVHDLPRGVGRGAVVLLAPRASLPFVRDDVPKDVSQRSWQAVSRHIREYTGKADPVTRFLLKELHAYMQDENLADPDLLRPEHFVVLAYADAAENALTTICERVSQLVAREWGPADEFAPVSRKGTRAFGWNYWEAWGLRNDPSGRGEIWLDWNARKEPAHFEADGRSLVFISGLTANDVEHLTPELPRPERSVSLEAGLRVDGRVVRCKRISDDCERFSQVAFPEEVLTGPTLDEQAESLARWIVAGFKALRSP